MVWKQTEQLELSDALTKHHKSLKYLDDLDA